MDCWVLWLLLCRSHPSCSPSPSAMPRSNMASTGFLWGWKRFLIFFKFFLSPAACSIISFFLGLPFWSSKLHIISAPQSCSQPALPQHLTHRGWMNTQSSPQGLTGLWGGYNTSPCSFASPVDSWRILHSQKVFCAFCFLSDPIACCLMNWMRDMPMETLIQSSLNLVKSYQQRFWAIASKHPNSPEK